MKKRLLLALVATFCLASACYADSVFMLQFGSFETEGEAQSHLTDLKAKNSGLLGGLPTSIRAVALPPDNLTVYRTQAGPMNTRAEAQAVCSQMASAGDECYVVETAMVQQGTPMGTKQVSPPTNVASNNPPPAPPAPAAAPPPPSIAAASPPPPAPPPAPPVAINYAPPVISDSNAPPPMETALAEAAAQQQVMNGPQSVPSPPPPVPPAQPKTLHSIWWHLDPFTPAPGQPHPTPKANVAVATPPAPVVITTPPASAVTVTAPSVTVASAPPMPQPVHGPVPFVPEKQFPPVPPPPHLTPVNDMNLPPPPPPLKAEDRTALLSPAPQTTGSLPAPQQVLVTPPVVIQTQPAPLTAGSGNVRVGEAQRVPLTAQTTMPPVIIVSGATQSQAPAVSLRPSATLGQKTLWAQIGQFGDAQSALAFWESYRQAHPDFPVVRVRVTTPYQVQMRGAATVSLRVGPFAHQQSITNLCATVGSDTNLRCGLVADLGMAADQQGTGYLPDSRYHRDAGGMR